MLQKHIANGQQLHPFDYQELTVAGSVVGLDQAKVEQAHAADLQFEAGPCRFTVVGGEPSSSFGLFGYDGREETLNLTQLVNFKAIRHGATNGVVRVVYYKPR